uniref:DUF4806 domain-containing protein n=1 Tax=Culex tarsalis TaxID=7177 RepID=A0A1Q3F067_CULTA
MYEIESVLMENDGTIDEEYLDESELQQTAQEPEHEPAPKKKIPIIRRPGEVVTPIHNQPQGTVKVSPSIFTSNQTAPRVTPNGPNKNTWQKVSPYRINVPLKPVTTSAPSKQITPSKRVQQVSVDDGDDGGDQNGFEAEYCRVKVEPSPPRGRVTLETLDAKLDALDEKLNRIVAKLGEHDGALKAVKFNIKEVRNELTTVCSSMQGIQDKARAPKRRRQPQIIFPIADDDHLLRLEELVHTNKDIREELFDRFLEANDTKVTAFMRKNIGYLLTNTSKYTWTGRPSNSNKDGEPSGVASQLSLVDVLIDSGCEKFSSFSRDDMEQEFKRALQRFNDAKFFKRRKRVLERLAAAAAMDGQEEDEGEEDGDEDV